LLSSFFLSLCASFGENSIPPKLHGYFACGFPDERHAAAGAARSPDDLFRGPQAWRGISAGLVKGFVASQVKQGYAIASSNPRLATIKVYCQLAMDAGALTPLALARISLVKGYHHKEGRNVDRERAVSRVGAKKALPTALNAGHAELLK
jgi:hypothetical protein